MNQVGAETVCGFGEDRPVAHQEKPERRSQVMASSAATNMAKFLV